MAEVAAAAVAEVLEAAVAEVLEAAGVAVLEAAVVPAAVLEAVDQAAEVPAEDLAAARVVDEVGGVEESAGVPVVTMIVPMARANEEKSPP